MSENSYTLRVSNALRLGLVAASIATLALPMVAQSAPGADRALAQALFTSTLDAKTLQPGANFTVKLGRKVHLTNGKELPSGTVLHGTVVSDDLNVAGDKKLALRFTTADVKGGQTIPIRATILGLQAESELGTADPNELALGTVGVDRIGVVDGVDLHSRFSSDSSGVFVASGKNDVKLKVGSAVDLAIAADMGGSSSGAQAGN